MAKIKFHSNDSPFYLSLKENVNKYFKDNKIKQTGNIYLHIKFLTLIPAAIFIYLTILFGKLATVYTLLLCGVEGFLFASIGFNVMHDACHGSFSSKKWVNTLAGYSLNALGGNAFIWKQKHNIIHHTYTNVDGIDDDIAKLPVIRQCPSQKWNKAHKYQHVYMMLVYALSSFLWIMVMDYTKYFNRKIYTTPMQKMSFSDHFIFWLSKVLYLFFYLALPMYIFGILPAILGFFVMHIFMGLTLALTFQLAHVVESTQFVDASTITTAEDEWAIHQVKTTANFAMDSKLVSWIAGGLNFQVEHHLFPRISHVHYPAISKIVKSHCEQYGIPYNSYPSVGSALASHIRFMKYLGKP
jgi:linoleoyl-CoA desaturase